jgi:hypothetical protein
MSKEELAQDGKLKMDSGTTKAKIIEEGDGYEIEYEATINPDKQGWHSGSITNAPPIMYMVRRDHPEDWRFYIPHIGLIDVVEAPYGGGRLRTYRYIDGNNIMVWEQ